MQISWACSGAAAQWLQQHEWPASPWCYSCKFSFALRRSFVAPLGQSSSPPTFRALLRNPFGELQMRSLADYVQAALMLNYNQRNVG